jgi:pimeloyl-ACP methyl ester carboxylesterase
MKIKIFLFAVFATFMFWGCDEDLGDDDVPKVYLVDFEEITGEDAISSEEVANYLKNVGQGGAAELAKYGVRLFKLVYKTSFDGKSQEVSGLLATPVAIEKKDRFPVMSYQHKTLTIKDKCPTKNYDEDPDKLISYLASTGMVILLPDYIGFGRSEDVFHPFMCKGYTVNSVIDFIRASKEFIFNNDPCEINDKLFLAGYSEGGSASLATLEAIEKGKVNVDFAVTATACGAGLYSLTHFLSWMVNQVRYEQPYVLAYILESFSTYLGLNIDYSLVYNPQVAANIPGMFDHERTIEELNSEFGGTTHIGELFNDDFENEAVYNSDDRYSQLRQLMEQNSVQAWNLSSDVTFYNGKDDSWVPDALSLEMYRQFRLEGATEKVKFDALENADHNEALVPMIVKAIQRFRQY